MPAILSHAISAVRSMGRAAAAAGGPIARRIAGTLRALRNRRAAGVLARLDDRTLADIGLTRSDIRDAYAEPIWRDPTDLLARRATERRGGQRSPDCAVSRECEPLSSAIEHPGPVACHPPLDRSPRHLV